MKTQFRINNAAWGIAGLLLAFTLSATQAQTYSIDWPTIDGGGGGTSPGGFLVYVCKDKTATALTAACLSLPKRSYGQWLAEYDKGTR